MNEFSWLEEIDHTGDCGFIIQATSLEQLFERSALGMLNVITDVDSILPNQKIIFTVTAEDRSSLLRTWLSQINFYHITNEFLFSRFHISAISDTQLTGIAWGEPLDLKKHSVFTEIKAVTFHGLKIEKQKSIWWAEIIFDL